jgi:hypothetical protein
MRLRLCKTLPQRVSEIYADRLLQLLILGVICGAFFFVLVLGADASIVLGILVIGCIAALMGRARGRNKK